MSEAGPIVIVVDDDPSTLRSTARLIRSAGFKVQTFASALHFKQNLPPEGPACLVLDVRMPGLSGLELQRELMRADRQIPIVFITGHGDIPMSVQAMRAGAVEFLTKPFREEALLNGIQLAITRDTAARSQRATLARLRANYAELTPREREVMGQVVFGLLNKQIAAKLGTTEKTVKAHRGQVMQKMHATSVAELVRMAGHLKISTVSDATLDQGPIEFPHTQQ